jgi:GNAT superfamily N-acetyltransferase
MSSSVPTAAHSGVAAGASPDTSTPSAMSAPTASGGTVGRFATHGLADAVEVSTVRNRRDLRQFLLLPWRIYADDPAWVPPLLMDQRTLLNRRKHPFHVHADVEYFLARSQGRVVGRIVAGVNHRSNEFHQEKAGFFGFFESVPDVHVARALLQAAERWIAARGLEFCRGPMNFSSNEEWGVLVDGFQHPPAVMMTHSPPYYAELLEQCGFSKAKDVFAYLLDEPPMIQRIAETVGKLQARRGVTVRTLNMRAFEAEVALIKHIYNQAWERNWGFVPMTDAEFEHLARDLKPVVDPRFCLIAEVGGQPVAFLLGLPDYNYALRHANGRLFPLGLLKILWHRRFIKRLRVITLGVLPGYRRLGIDAMLYTKVWVDGVAAGFDSAECSWILEDNLEMRRPLERLGGRPYKTYRIFEKRLDAGPPAAAPSSTSP